jgi:hypothetical protein
MTRARPVIQDIPRLAGSPPVSSTRRRSGAACAATSTVRAGLGVVSLIFASGFGTLLAPSIGKHWLLFIWWVLFDPETCDGT